METEEKKIYKIQGKRLDSIVNKIVDLANEHHEWSKKQKPEEHKKRKRRSPLCFHRNVWSALFRAMTGETIERIAVHAGYKRPETFKKILQSHLVERAPRYKKLFAWWFEKARAELSAKVHENIYEEIENGNIGLSRELQKALNAELNPQQKIESTINNKVEITYEDKNPREIDREYHERLKKIESKMRLLPECQKPTEMRKNGDGSYEPASLDDERKS